MPTRVDSLYQYDEDNSRLIPTFTLNFPNTDKIPWHGYGEWPHHFIGDFSEPPIEVAPGAWTNGQTYPLHRGQKDRERFILQTL